MAGCRIVNQSVEEAVGEIQKISKSYEDAGADFVKDLNNALSEMEGEAKDALNNFINTDVQKFIVEDIPLALTGMSELLEANRSNFESVDKQIADSISGS